MRRSSADAGERASIRSCAASNTSPNAGLIPSTYVLLIYRTAASSDAISDEAARNALAGHRAVQAEAHARGELQAVAQLGDPRSAITVRRGQVAHDVTDGPYIETKEWLVGFYLLDCSEAEAIERAKQITPDPDHAVEVRPVSWRWNG